MEKLSLDYHVQLAHALGVPPEKFQTLLSPPSLSSTSRDLWKLFDCLPQATTSFSFDSSSLKNFYDIYTSVLSQLKPQTNPNALVDALGDDYDKWLKIKSTYSGPGSIVEFYKNNCQGLNNYSRGLTVLLQQKADPVNRALENAFDTKFLDDDGVAKYTPDIATAQQNVLAGGGVNFVVSTDNSTENLNHVFGSGSVSGAYSLFSASAGGSYDYLSKKICSDEVHVNVKWESTAQLRPVKGGWFNSGVLSTAYKRNDFTYWSLAAVPNWQDTFGASGSLSFLNSSFWVGDGMTLTLTTTHKFSKEEKADLNVAASGGIWPFFRASASGGSQTKVGFNEDDTATITVTTTKGAPKIIGAVVTTVQEVFGA